MNIVKEKSRTCSIKECNREHYGKGLCKYHYQQNRQKIGIFHDPPEEVNKHSTIRPIKYIVDENGCHICTSHKNKVRGYPMISRKGSGKSETIIRYLYEQKYGAIPKGIEVCHTCDNPACINIDHGWLGTHKENMMDMGAKGRWNPKSARIGEQNGTAKLTNNLVKQIRNTNFKYGEKTKFCKQYGITRELLWLVEKGKIWKHIHV